MIVGGELNSVEKRAVRKRGRDSPDEAGVSAWATMRRRPRQHRERADRDDAPAPTSVAQEERARPRGSERGKARTEARRSSPTLDAVVPKASRAYSRGERETVVIVEVEDPGFVSGGEGAGQLRSSARHRRDIRVAR